MTSPPPDVADELGPEVLPIIALICAALVEAGIGAGASGHMHHSTWRGDADTMLAWLRRNSYG